MRLCLFIVVMLSCSSINAAHDAAREFFAAGVAGTPEHLKPLLAGRTPASYRTAGGGAAAGAGSDGASSSVFYTPRSTAHSATPTGSGKKPRPMFATSGALDTPAQAEARAAVAHARTKERLALEEFQALMERIACLVPDAPAAVEAGAGVAVARQLFSEVETPVTDEAFLAFSQLAAPAQVATSSGGRGAMAVHRIVDKICNMLLNHRVGVDAVTDEMFCGVVDHALQALLRSRGIHEGTTDYGTEYCALLDLANERAQSSVMGHPLRDIFMMKLRLFYQRLHVAEQSMKTQRDRERAAIIERLRIASPGTSAVLNKQFIALVDMYEDEAAVAAEARALRVEGLNAFDAKLSAWRHWIAEKRRFYGIDTTIDVSVS